MLILIAAYKRGTHATQSPYLLGQKSRRHRPHVLISTRRRRTPGVERGTGINGKPELERDYETSGKNIELISSIEKPAVSVLDQSSPYLLRGGVYLDRLHGLSKAILRNCRNRIETHLC